MKNKIRKTVKTNEHLREEILHSMIASFKIEGINIPAELALATLKKIELNLGKQK